MKSAPLFASGGSALLQSCASDEIRSEPGWNLAPGLSAVSASRGFGYWQPNCMYSCMFENHRFAGILAGIACLAGFSLVAAAQDRDQMRVQCASGRGGRVFCDIGRFDGAVRLARQTGRAQCLEGYSWGHDNDRIWVDHGCSGEFQLVRMERREGNLTQIESGTVIAIRTNESIRTNRVDGRIFTGITADNVIGGDGRLAIPQGSSVELIVRAARDRDLIIDLESVMVNGQRYAVDATPNRVESSDGVGSNRRTGEFVGGGAALGAIIGAIAGGGKGAAIGAGAGAAGGAIGIIATSGREVRIPAESIVTFRIGRPLVMNVGDRGSFGSGHHYHREGR